ncbi:MAG TPA: hypothetical protein VGK67_27495 [Myxococcales bacterium]|jgi:hypothetical protein
MAHDPDVLDNLGFVPRELGSVHLHVEPVLVVEAERRAYVTALLQPAFEGRLTGKLVPTALTATGDRAVAADLAIPIPALDRQVLRWRFSFPLLVVPEEILFRLEAPIPKDAERIRTAWKLVGTFEQPKEVRRASGALLSSGARLRLSLAHDSHADFSVHRIPDDPESARDIQEHPAPESIDGFVAQILLAPSAQNFRDGVEVLWKPGMDLPAPPRPKPIAAPSPSLRPARSRRPCPSCGHDVDIAEAEHDLQCPACGAPWLY